MRRLPRPLPARSAARAAVLVGLCVAAAACGTGVEVRPQSAPASSGPAAAPTPGSTTGSPGSSPAAGASAGTTTPPAGTSAGSSASATPGSAAGGSPGPEASAPAGGAAPGAGATPAALPRGGTSIFPRHLVVMHYGTAGTGALGVLGERPPEQAAKRLERVAATWERPSGRPVLPAFELITTVASSKPGEDGQYSSYLDVASVKRYLQVARKNKMLLVLDFQPGRASFLEQVKRYEEVLREPEVGVALDPEWKLTSSQRPLQQIGVSRAAPINEVSEYLADIVRRENLPEKIFLVHQFKVYQLPDRKKIVDREGLATVLHVDGFGSQEAKFQTYGVLASRDKQFVNGFKLFIDEDTDMLTPAETMRIKPRPELISYQ